MCRISDDIVQVDSPSFGSFAGDCSLAGAVGWHSEVATLPGPGPERCHGLWRSMAAHRVSTGAPRYRRSRSLCTRFRELRGPRRTRYIDPISDAMWPVRLFGQLRRRGLLGLRVVYQHRQRRIDCSRHLHEVTTSTSSHSTRPLPNPVGLSYNNIIYVTI